MEAENEFESKYKVDDLLIGHVSIIGVYKGSVTENFITSNTFNYMTALGGNQQVVPEKKVFPSSSSQPLNAIMPKGSEPKGDNKYSFIDIIAIVQDVSFYTPPAEDVTEKLPWYKRVWNWLRGRTK